MLIGVGATILQFLAILTSFVSIMESIKRTMGQFGALFLVDFFLMKQLVLRKFLELFFFLFGIFFILNY